MAYQVLYRTYRPQKFEEVVGQEYIIKTLKNAIKLNKIAHAYLFAGPRGTGKTTIAKLFAKAINCESFKEEACDNCPSCATYNASNHPDIIEMDAASKSRVEDIREILDEVPYAPLIGKYKVYIIDEVHMLSQSAFNALLKTLEEPPAHVVFILATTDPQKVIPTVLSRCQRYNFSKISSSNMILKMKEILDKEKVPYEESALSEVAALAEGGMRDALSILEQILSYNSGSVNLSDVQKIFGLSSIEEKVNLLVKTHTSKTSEVIESLRSMYLAGIDIKRLAIDLLDLVKEALIYADANSAELLNKLSEEDGQRILENVNIRTLLKDADALEECIVRHGSQNFLTYLELALIKMANSKAISEVKEEVKTPALKEEVKEVVKEVKPEIVKEKEEEIDLNFLASLLLDASKDLKIADAVIYNRLELYKFEPDKRKFYELLTGSSIFASSGDAIIAVCDKARANTLNSKEIQSEIYNFIYKEFGIDKVIYAISEKEKEELINLYRRNIASGNLIKVVVKKPELIKEETIEDKLKEMFGDIRVE